MKETIKNLIHVARRFKLATTLNLVGLVVAFAAFYLMMTQVIYQRTYNHGFEDYKRLYRMESDNVYNEYKFCNLVCRPFGDALQRMPEVENYSLVYNPGMDSYLKEKFIKTGKVKPDTIPYIVYPCNYTAVSTLTNKVLDGSIEWSDKDQKGIIIPASIAKEYFGTVKAAGKEMKTDKGYTYVVRGIYENFPKNSERPNSIYRYYYDSTLSQDSLALEAGYQCIVKFKTVPKDLNTTFVSKLKQAIISHLKEGLTAEDIQEELAVRVEQVEMTNIQFTPLDESYFEYESFTPGEKGYRGLYHLLILTSLLVLVIAAINFLNFTLAESPVRIRGLNTRLVLGASRRSLQLGFVGEGVITSVVACVFALVVCHLLQLLPVVKKLTDGSLALQDHWLLILAMLVLAIIVGIAASVYPSAFATSFPPAIALKGAFGLTPQGQKLRKILMRIQLCVSMLMIIYLGMLYRQSHYIFNSEYGFDNDRILVSELPLPESYDYSAENDTLYHAITEMPGVEDVAFSESLLGLKDGHLAQWTKQNDETFKFSLMHATRNYLSTMGFNITDGRGFLPEDTLAAVINQGMHIKRPWIILGRTKLATSETVGFPDSATVVGICENMRYGTIRIVNSLPFMLVFKEGYELLGNLIVRVAPEADKGAVKKKVDDLLKSRYGSDAEPVKEFKESLIRTYANEFRYVNQMVVICFICLIITLIGVFCLTLFETEYRRKEIGIRKISGATTSEIVWLLCRQYVNHILIAFAIAAPLAFSFVFFTLNLYKQHAPIDWWMFPFALLLVGGITLGTVLLRSIGAARENPVNSIQSE